MITFTITWAMFNWIGLILFVLGFVGLLKGTLPCHKGQFWGNALRWITWPLFLVWVVVIMIKGLFL